MSSTQPKRFGWGFFLWAALAFAQHAPQRPAGAVLDSTSESRVHALGKQLRCPMCQGLSIADSGSSVARAQLERIRDLVSQGKSDGEILDYFVARYGEWALLSPKRQGLNWILWLGPVGMVVVGVWILHRRKKKDQPAPSEKAASEESGDFLARVRQDVSDD